MKEKKPGIVTPDIGPPLVPYILKDIEERLPGLQELTIIYDERLLPRFDDELSGLFGRLRHLRCLSLPFGCLSLPFGCLNATFMQLVALHLQLEKISLGPFSMYPTGSVVSPLYDPDVRPLPPDAFPSLRHLEFSTGTLSNAGTFLSQTGFPAGNLVSIWLHTEIIPSSSQLGVALEGLASICAGLQNLEVFLCGLVYDFDFALADLKTINTINLQDLAPLTRFPSLRSFIISHPYPIATNSDADLSTVVSPLMTCIKLNPHPIVPGPTNLTLGAYAFLMEHYPRLQEIGLFVDAEKPVPTPAPSSRRLTAKVHVGSPPLPITADAPITVYPAIARFLASIFSASSTWVYPDEEVFTAEAIDKEDWLPELTEKHETEKYLNGWKAIETMIRLVEWGRENEGDRNAPEMQRLREEIARLKSELSGPQV